jgi:hypothetical protein
MNETTKDKPKYSFFIEVRPTEDGETVRCEWTGLTLLAAKQMYKATDKNYSVQAAYLAPLAMFCWEEMK